MELINHATITCMRQGQDDKKLGFDVVLSDDQGNKLNLSYKAVGDKLVHTADDLYLVDQSPADQEKEDSNEESSIVGRSYTLKITLDDLKNEASRFVSIYGKKNQQLVNRKMFSPRSSCRVSCRRCASGWPA